MPEANLAQRLAQYAHGLKYENLPASTIHEVKRRFIDSLGCAMGAFHSDPATIARRIASTVSSTQPATVIGTSYASSPEMAAFSNGVHFRYLDFNDTYLSLEPAHPSDNIAAILAAGEPHHASGRDLILATALAYEIQCRLCDACSIRARGWDHVTYGSFSATLAAGKLLRLSEEQLVHAQGLAGNPNNAMRQTRVGELSMWKGCAFANASRNAVFAARLAQMGLTGPAPIFEGGMGFFKQVSGEFELDASKFGGQTGSDGFMIDRTYIKYWPAEYHSQSAIDAALQMRDEIGSTNHITSILIESFDAAVDIIGGEPEKWRPQSRETADHSLPYCVAAALVDGDIWLEQFDEARFRDESLLALVAKIRVDRDAGLSARYPEGIPNRITVTLDTGRTVQREVTYPRGHAGNPMTDAEVETKFKRLAEPVIGSAKVTGALERLWKLDTESDISGILRLFAIE